MIELFIYKKAVVDCVENGKCGMDEDAAAALLEVMEEDAKLPKELEDLIASNKELNWNWRMEAPEASGVLSLLFVRRNCTGTGCRRLRKPHLEYMEWA